jgi:peptide/nickel transport system substrate-binding protein
MASDDRPSSTGRDGRRRFLQALGAGTVVGVAGCTGNEQQTTTESGGDGSGGDTETESDSGDGSGGDTETESSDDGGDSEGKTFVKAKNQPLTHLDPHAINDGTMIELDAVYDQLLDYADGDPTTIRPMLATDWEPQNGGEQWVLTLREGVEFEDGTPFDAYAAKRSLMRAKQLEAGQSKPYDWFTGVEETGDYEITINCDGSFGPAPAALTFITVSMLNPTVMDEHWDEENYGHEYWKNNVHGTGAFNLDNWDKGNEFTASLDEDNWRFDLEDPPDNLLIEEGDNITAWRTPIIREQLTQKQQLARGDIDIARDLSWTNTQEVRQQDGVDFYDGPADLYAKYVFMMCQREPTSDVNFRKALAYAADYQGIAEELIGTGIPWGVPWAEGIWPRVEEGMYRQDLEKAQQFLEDSVYDGEELTFRSIQGSANDKIGEALVANFDQIGVTVDHEDIPWSNLYEQLTSAETMPDLLMYSGWPDYADPNGPAIRYWGEYFPPDGWNTAYYANDEYDEMFVEARSTGDRDRREELYKQMQEIIIDEVPIIWLFQETYKRAYNADVEELSYTPGEFNYLPGHQFKKQ